MSKRSLARLSCLALLLFLGTGHAAEVSVAVAANFTAPMKRIAAEFEQATGHRAVLAFGSTGQLYAQIRNGAPFEILLAADDETPTRLVKENAALSGTQFTYAIGKLVLWSATTGRVDSAGNILKQGGFEKLAVANPKLAPYGAAAMRTMRALSLLDALQSKLVMGENINQTYQFAATGNAQLGFVALSQVTRDGKIPEGSAWIVPAHLYEPIKQDTVVLERGRGKPAAEALMKYLRGDKARAVIKSYGYELGS